MIRITNKVNPIWSIYYGMRPPKRNNTTDKSKKPKQKQTINTHKIDIIV